ncbi:hypothetical protein [Sphingomonas sp. Leaf17]|uniref:hypothetical protein n=1 Tax=Sphingomonas sp. Leaf17 TaxID=1735683 RepID=UPI0012E26E59|nr:hypothetical protein [Sphingomonas sp. Leaf17]
MVVTFALALAQAVIPAGIQAGTRAKDMPERPVFTAAEVAAASPATLADALLPADHPPIVRAQVLPAGGDGATRRLEAVLLDARPAPGPSGFCHADTFRIAFAPFEYATDTRAGGQRYRARDVTRTALFRLDDGAACLADTRGYFPVAGSQAPGLAAVRALAATRRAAEAGGRLPVTACADPTGSGACRGGARAVLAALRTDAIGSVRVNGCTAPCPVEILVGTAGPRPAYWTMLVTMRGDTATRIAMRYTLSPTR